MESFECYVCKRKLLSRCSLNRHIRNICGNDGTLVPCPICKKGYKSEESLKSHISYYHVKRLDRLVENESNSLRTNESESTTKTTDKTSDMVLIPGKYPCRICSEVFLCEQFLKDHVKKVHGSKTGIISRAEQYKIIKYRKTNVMCSEEGCDNMPFPNMKSFRKHLKEFHKKDLAKSTYYFPSLEEFNNWKDNLEAKIGITYALNRKYVPQRDNKVKRTYICRRSGVYKTKSTGKRALKNQGSCKLGFYCNSTIELCIIDGFYIVNHFEDHTGHILNINELSHTLIPQRTRQFIADKLANGVPRKLILKMVRERSGEGKAHLIKNQDLINIENELKNKIIKPSESETLPANENTKFMIHTTPEVCEKEIKNAIQSFMGDIEEEAQKENNVENLTDDISVIHKRIGEKISLIKSKVQLYKIEALVDAVLK